MKLTKQELILDILLVLTTLYIGYFHFGTTWDGNTSAYLGMIAALAAGVGAAAYMWLSTAPKRLISKIFAACNLALFVYMLFYFGRLGLRTLDILNIKF